MSNLLNIRKKEIYLYTKGNELSLDGINYIGEYHIHNGMFKTGPVETPNSKLLTVYYGSIDVYNFDILSNSFFKKYSSPINRKIQPEDADYERGYFIRYFTFKVNEDNPIIYEINSDDNDKFNTFNGINGSLYSILNIKWVIKGNPIEVTKINYNTVLETETKYKLKNLITVINDFNKWLL